MSTLKVTNIQATGETASRAVSGVAAAWVDFVQATATAVDSMNVSSITDNGTGDFTVNFNSALANSGYAYSGFADSTGATSSLMIFRLAPTAAKLAGSCGIFTGYATTSVGFTKYEYIGLVFTAHGDLA